jgi:hypothetical protein
LLAGFFPSGFPRLYVVSSGVKRSFSATGTLLLRFLGLVFSTYSGVFCFLFLLLLSRRRCAFGNALLRSTNPSFTLSLPPLRPTRLPFPLCPSFYHRSTSSESLHCALLHSSTTFSTLYDPHRTPYDGGEATFASSPQRPISPLSSVAGLSDQLQGPCVHL